MSVFTIFDWVWAVWWTYVDKYSGFTRIKFSKSISCLMRNSLVCLSGVSNVPHRMSHWPRSNLASEVGASGCIFVCILKSSGSPSFVCTISSAIASDWYLMVNCWRVNHTRAPCFLSCFLMVMFWYNFDSFQFPAVAIHSSSRICSLPLPWKFESKDNNWKSTSIPRGIGSRFGGYSYRS